MTHWNPNMDEAPRDGTAVLLYCADGGIARPWYYEGPDLAVCIGWYGNAHEFYGPAGVWVSTDVEGGVVEYGEYTGSAFESEHLRVFPTHWMLTPQPPSKGETESEESQ